MKFEVSPLGEYNDTTMNSVEQNNFEPQTPRYQRIDELNKESFLLTEGSQLQVIQSLHSVGAPRDILTPELTGQSDIDVIQKAQRVGRTILAGNVSPLKGYGPNKLSAGGRLVDAKKNVYKFLYQHDVNPSDVRVLKPDRDYETPLTVINLEDESFTPDGTGLLQPDTSGDMMYTYSAELVMAARPADCPIVFVSAETPKGVISVLLHLATLGVAHGYVSQAKQILDDLGVDWSTVRAQLTSGGHAETYTYTGFKEYNPIERFPESKGLYPYVEEVVGDDGKLAYDFTIDLAAEAYEQIVEQWGIDNYQIFLDTSDTTSPKVGYSSNSRAFKGYAVNGENTRDIVLARRVAP